MYILFLTTARRVSWILAHFGLLFVDLLELFYNLWYCFFPSLTCFFPTLCFFYLWFKAALSFTDETYC